MRAGSVGLRNAERLVEHHAVLGSDPAQSNPCTQVHVLVARLNELSG